VEKELISFRKHKYQVNIATGQCCLYLYFSYCGSEVCISWKL